MYIQHKYNVILQRCGHVPLQHCYFTLWPRCWHVSSQRCENNLHTTLYNIVFTLCVCWVLCQEVAAKWRKYNEGRDGKIWVQRVINFTYTDKQLRDETIFSKRFYTLPYIMITDHIPHHDLLPNPYNNTKHMIRAELRLHYGG